MFQLGTTVQRDIYKCNTSYGETVHDWDICQRLWDSKEFSSCLKFGLDHVGQQRGGGFNSFTTSHSFVSPPLSFSFYNLCEPCQTLIPLLFFSLPFEKIRHLLIGGADNHSFILPFYLPLITIPPSTHPTVPFLCIRQDFLETDQKLNFTNEGLIDWLNGQYFKEQWQTSWGLCSVWFVLRD